VGYDASQLRSCVVDWQRAAASNDGRWHSWCWYYSGRHGGEFDHCGCMEYCNGTVSICWKRCQLSPVQCTLMCVCPSLLLQAVWWSLLFSLHSLSQCPVIHQHFFRFAWILNRFQWNLHKVITASTKRWIHYI